MKGQCIDEQDLTGIISNGKYGFIESLDKLQCAVTREMTPYELKFALLVENTLNYLSEPEMLVFILFL